MATTIQAPTILKEKSFIVGEHMVQVQRQDQPGSDKPHQVVLRAHQAGIDKVQTTSYPEGCVGNADFEYIDFDEKSAAKFIERFTRFLNTVKGKKLVGEGSDE
jgi:hypothetical protein